MSDWRIWISIAVGFFAASRADPKDKFLWGAVGFIATLLILLFVGRKSGSEGGGNGEPGASLPGPIQYYLGLYDLTELSVMLLTWLPFIYVKIGGGLRDPFWQEFIEQATLVATAVLLSLFALVTLGTDEEADIQSWMDFWRLTPIFWLSLEIVSRALFHRSLILIVVGWVL